MSIRNLQANAIVVLWKAPVPRGVAKVPAWLGGGIGAFGVGLGIYIGVTSNSERRGGFVTLRPAHCARLEAAARFARPPHPERTRNRGFGDLFHGENIAASEEPLWIQTALHGFHRLDLFKRELKRQQV
jgi:hypothetical protein